MGDTASRTEGLLAVDIGTSAIRATVLGAEDGAVLAAAREPTPTRRTPEGGATLDAAECWARTAEVIGRAARGRRIAAVGVSAQLGMVLVDTAGAAVSPVYLWSDRTAEDALDGVRAVLAETPGLPHPGRRITAEATAVRLRSLASNDPGLVERAAAVLTLKDYLVARLTGEFVCDPTHASYTLLFDIAARQWSPRVADALGLPAGLLPPVRPADAPAGTVTGRAAEETGLPEGLVVAVGGPDGTVGSLGAGAVAPGRTVDIAGSTDVLVHVVDRPVLDERTVVNGNAHLLDGMWTLGGPTGMTGSAIDWLAGVLGHGDSAGLESALGDAVAAVPPGSRGVLVDTALTGHRYPYWDLASGGRIAGLRPDVGAAELVSAAHEGAAFLVAEGLRELERLGERPASVTVVGGVARRPASLQLRADVWRVEVEGVADGLATSRGAALLAAVAAGRHPDAAAAASGLVARGDRYVPDAARSARYAEALEAWRGAFRPGP